MSKVPTQYEIDPIENKLYFGVQIKDSNSRPIKDAEVMFDSGGLMDGGDIKYTDSDGRADTWMFLESAPQDWIITCFVSKDGYVSKSDIIIKGNQDGPTYKSVTLQALPDINYCTCLVIENGTSSPVSGAEVKVYATSDTSVDPVYTKTTQTNGKCSVLCPSESSGYYFKVSKNGYVTSDLTYIPRRSSPTMTTTISLKKTVSGNYYYNIQVNTETGSPFKGGGEIRLFNDFSLSTPCIYCERISTSSTDGRKELFYDIREIISDILNIEEARITENSKLVDDLGCDASDISNIVRRFGDKYQMAADENTVSGFIRVADMVTFVQGGVSEVYRTIYPINTTTGLVSVERANLQSTPKTVYAKGMPFDANAYYTWSMPSGPVTPSTESDYVGLTLTVSTNEIEENTHHYNFLLKDWCTGKPLNGVTVSYTYKSKVIETVTSNSSGLASFKCGLSPLSVNFEKDGFASFGMSYPGDNDPSKYNVVNMSPKNTIKVEYGSDCPNPGPASGILVSIGSYDDLGKYIELGRYTTGENGYIDTLSNSYFTANKYVAVVLKYTPEDNNAVINLKRYLTVGENVITLPKRIEEDEEEEYVTFYDLTANAIKKNVNKGNKELGNQNSSQRVSYNDNTFRINILDPDSITTYDIFESYPVIMNNNQKSVIGSVDMGLKPDANNLKLKVINRYSGYYNPIFKDILFYDNMTVDDEPLPYSNTSFDPSYEDKLGKFGIIRNMWFHKVNDNKDVEIFNTLTPYYPLTGQYALDFRDYNIFESNWDINHFVRQLDVNTSEPCQNISSMKNGVCMFGSKYLNVPEVIDIYGFDLGDDPNWNGEWNDDWITNPDGCPGELMFKEVNDNSVDFYFFLKKRILRFFYNKLKDEFESYMNPEDRSFGKPGVEDDIKEYVTKNVLKLYKLEKVRMFVRRTKKGLHNSRIENDYTTYLDEYDYSKTEPEQRTAGYFRRKGFVEVNNITLTKINRDDFDRKLVYNLRNGTQEEFGFGFRLRKI